MESVVVFAVIIFVIIFAVTLSNKNKEREDLSYSFGFPTHVSYNYGGGPLVGAWPGLLRYPGWNKYYNGYPWYRPPYLGNYLHYSE